MRYVAKTRRDFESYFRREILPYVRDLFEPDGRVDKPARREEWNNHIDVLLRDGELPPRAVEWRCPW
jgi:hypothetical protein